MDARVCPKCGKHNLVNAWNCADCGVTLSINTLVEKNDLQKVPLRAEDTPADIKHFMAKIPSCDKCGRQDDTLRLVAYPYVASFLVITHRNVFAGLMCRKHRYLYWLLASAITGTIGWIGIPFGIIYTPVALLDLAYGGNQPKDSNFQMLKNLAKHKSDQGDAEGAIKCLEASLQFSDDGETRKEIQQYRMRSFTPGEGINLRTNISSIIYLLLGAAIIGSMIGVLDYVITWIFSSVFPTEIGIYLVILSWAPLFVLAFVGGLALSQLIEWAITRTSLQKNIFAIGLSGIAAFIAVYSIAQGEAISDYLQYLMMGGGFESTLDAIYTSARITSIGGFLYIMWLLNGHSIAGTIFVILIAVLLVYYLSMAVRTAVKTATWQKQLAA